MTHEITTIAFVLSSETVKRKLVNQTVSGKKERLMGRHAASRPGRLRPQHNTDDISLRNIEENTVPKREDRQSQGVGYRLLQLFAGMSIFLAIILVMHVGWVYIGNGMDQIHTQQTIVTNQGFKTAQPTKTDGSTRIAKPQTGEPPTEPEPEYSTVIGWMRIPRFGAEWQRAIQEGTDLKVLDNYGIGHYQGTVMPGSIGNSSYAGHRTPGDLGPADTLKPGDPIIIQTAGHWYVYEMQSSWMTTPDDAAVIADQTDQKDARLITLTTCKYSLDEQDSLSARLIVRGRFKYWANTADGIPKELASKQSTPIQQAKATITRSIQKASKYAPVSQLLFTATLTIWCILTGLSWLIWHKDRQKKTTSWNLMTLIWRIQSGPIILRATTCLFFWITLLFAEWAWISPLLSQLIPLSTGTATLN